MKRRIGDAVAVLFVVWAGLALTPLEWWGFVPGDVVVADTTTTEAAGVGFSREIRRPIRMRYSVIVRRVQGYEVTCDAASATFTYHPDSTLPADADLTWWAPGDARCAALFPPGDYVMETCWTAPGLLFGALPPKTTCRTSNVFHVFDGEP